MDDNFEDSVEKAATEARSTGWDVNTSFGFFLVSFCYITEEHERNPRSSQVATGPSKCLLTYNSQPGFQLPAPTTSPSASFF